MINSKYYKAVQNLKARTIREETGKKLEKGLLSFKDLDSLKYSLGNSKIGTDTIIFSFSTAHSCVSAFMGLCNMGRKETGGNGFCYALKSEKQYINSKLFKTISGFQWHYFSAEFIASEFIRILKKHKKVKYIRLNEAGDFANYEEIYKLKIIALLIQEYDPSIKIYTYTHRKDLKNYFFVLPNNVTINGSNFMVHNEYKVITEKKDKRKLARITMTCDPIGEGCKTCNLCKVSHCKTIIQTIH